MTDDDREGQPFIKSLRESQDFRRSLTGDQDSQDPFGDHISVVQDPPTESADESGSSPDTPSNADES